MSQDTAFSVESLSGGAQRALYNLITILGDNKFRLGIRYAEYGNAAPTLEAGIAAAAMAQDELGHTRNLFPLLREFSWATNEAEDGFQRALLRHLAWLDQPFADWGGFIAVNFLFDQAITIVLESAQDSVFTALRQRARKMVVEERFHSMYASGWFSALANANAAVHDELAAEACRGWAEVLCFFGPEGNAGLQILKDEGILNANSVELRARFLQRIMPAWIDLKLDLNAHDLPWARWNMQTWRLNPQT